MIDVDTGEIVGMEPNQKPFIRTPYNYDRNLASNLSGLDASAAVNKGRTQQQFKEETDINTIVKRFGLTGQLPQNVKIPLGPDFIEATDYHQALNLMIEAEAGFMQLPADVRKRFDNDPGNFVAFVDDDKNREEAEKLGIVLPKPKAPAATAPAPTTPPKEGGVT